MSESSAKPICILNGTNYESWKTRILLKFETLDIAYTLFKSEYVDKKVDIKARNLILESIDPSLDNLVIKEKTALEMWNNLELQFNSESMTSVMDLFTQFVSMKLNDDEDVTDYYNRLVTTVTQ